jgi:hypothetical protein
MLRGGHRASLLLATSAIAWSGNADASETIAYSYDGLGRLVRVERSGTVNNGVDVAYSYDSADNRTNVTVATSGSPSGPAVAGGGFEAPEVGTGYVYRPSGSPATFTGNSGITANATAWGFDAAPEGDQVAFVQSYGVASVITLSVSGLTPGAGYKVRFWIASRPGYGTNPVTVAFNGAALGTFQPVSAAFAAVTSAAFTASGASGTLTLTGSDSAADLGTGLDSVTIVPTGSN